MEHVHHKNKQFRYSKHLCWILTGWLTWTMGLRQRNRIWLRPCKSGIKSMLSEYFGLRYRANGKAVNDGSASYLSTNCKQVLAEHGTPPTFWHTWGEPCIPCWMCLQCSSLAHLTYVNMFAIIKSEPLHKKIVHTNSGKRRSSNITLRYAGGRPAACQMVATCTAPHPCITLCSCLAGSLPTCLASPYTRRERGRSI